MDVCINEKYLTLFLHSFQVLISSKWGVGWYHMKFQTATADRRCIYSRI